MSGRHRRSETLWDKKEEKMPPGEVGRKIPWRRKDLHSSVHGGSSPKWSEANDGIMPGDFSGRPSWEPLKGNGNMPKDDDINRDRRRMQTDPAFDEWEKQYSTRPSDDSYVLPYRGRDRGVGGSERMSRDKDRSRSPKRSRSRSRGRDRGRDWESTRARSRSPLCDDRRESNEYADERNDSRVPSRPCYSGGSRYGDNRNAYDDQDRRHQSTRNSRVPCKFFSVGKCNRDDCKFSHDAPESGRYDGRSHENIWGRNLGNKNRTWNDRLPQDDLYASDFSDFAKSNHNFNDKNKSWNGPSWDDMDSGGFDERSRDNILGRTSDDKSRTRDGQVPGDDMKKLLDGPSWDDVDASGFPGVRNSKPNLDNKNRPWDGPSRDEVIGSSFSNVPKPCHNSDDSKKLWNGTSTSTMSASGFSYGAKSGNNIDGKPRSWNGPSWDEVSESGYCDIRKSSGGDGTSAGMLQTNSNIRKWDGPAWNEKTSEKNDYLLINDSDVNNANMVSADADQQNLTSGEGSIQCVHDMSSQSLPNLNGTEQSHHMLLSNPFNGPKIQLNGQVQGMFVHMDSHKQTEIQNKEGGRPLKHLEMDVPRVMNETRATSEQVPIVNGLSASLPEISQKGQLPQVYTELNLANAIDFLNSLPNSASSGSCIDPAVFQYNQDTRPKELYDSARSMEVNKLVKTSIPMGILSGSVRQENQMPVERFPPISTGGSNSSKLSEIGMVEKEYGTSPKTKKQDPVGNPEGTESREVENAKQEQENINPDNSEAQGKVEEGNISNDEKAMRQFKVALVEFVKEILKPTWKEGKMSREVHKTVVKKVVDKVTSTIQGIQIPRTQTRIEQYLAYSKSKITKLVEAYVERLLKA